MKAYFVSRIVSALALGSLSFLAGCEAEESSNEATNTSTNQPASTAVTTPATNEVAEAVNLADDVIIEPKVQSPPPALSAAADEIVQLARAKVEAEVILAYVEGTTTPFHIKAPEILYLNDLGLPPSVISAMVRRDRELAAEATSTEKPTEAIAQASAAITPEEGQASDASETAAIPSPAAEPAPGSVPTTPVAEVATQPAPESVTYNYFYENLAPYGTWRDIPDYGWCWQPTVAVVTSGWRPYCHNGRWIWTDHGWYWNSYYSWGWGPFHYGRWQLSPTYGWVWAPDNVWGPAWVTWRYYDGYCGWAPLPPGAYWSSGLGFTFHGSHVSVGFGFGLSSACYAFVPTRHFYTASPWSHCAGSIVVNRFYGRTTIINNYAGHGGIRVINHGIDTHRITAATRTEIRRVSLRDANPTHGSPVRAERLSRDGANLAVYRPNVPKPAAAPPPEITRRQQEVRQHSERLASSESVKIARANAVNRSVAPSSFSNSGQPSTAPRSVRSSSQPNINSNSRTATPRRTEPRSVANPSPTPSAVEGRQQDNSNHSIPAPARPPTRTEPSRSRPSASPSQSYTAPQSVTPSRTEERPTRSYVPPATTRIEPQRSTPPQSYQTPASPSRGYQSAPSRPSYDRPSAAPTPSYRPSPAPSSPPSRSEARPAPSSPSVSPAPAQRSAPSSPPASSSSGSSRYGGRTRER